MMETQQNCEVQRCCCYRPSALAGVEGGLGGVCVAQVSHVSAEDSGIYMHGFLCTEEL